MNSLITLRLGSKSIEVYNWKNFLRGLHPHSDLVVDNIFDQKTVVETILFQKSNNLPADGVVGLKTYTAAMAEGFDPGIQDDREDENNVHWPTKPLGVNQLNPVDREKLFGKFSYIAAPVPSNPEAIKITDGWDKNNIVKVVIPQLKNVQYAPKDCGIFVHKLVASQFQKLFSDWEEADLLDRVLTFGGTYVPRFIRGSKTSLSNHSWGTAIDLNVQWNGLGTMPPTKNEKGSVRELVEIAVKNGFYWLGWAQNRKDGMHFEIFKLIK